MITRRHISAGTRSVAVYSDCESYRYSLTRTWAPEGPRLLFVMLNPSTADERRNDPTVERCERRARRLGYGAFRVANLFALRATDPRDMRRAAEPVGPENDRSLRRGAAWADHIIAAWGVHGAHRGRGAEVARLLAATGAPLFHLGCSKGGHPRHPLYLSYACDPRPWDGTTPTFA